FVAEARAGLAGIGIHGMKFGIFGSDIQDFLAGLAGHGIGGVPVGKAATLDDLPLLEICLGAVDPFGLPAIGGNREDPRIGRADIDGVVDEQRRRRPGGAPGSAAAFAGSAGYVAGVQAP